MKFDIDRRSIPAIVFFIAAMGLLVASVRTTTLAEKAVEDARSGLIPAEKAQNAPDFTLPAVTVGAKSTPSVNLHNAAAEEPVVFSFWASYCQYCPMEMTHLQQYAQKYKGKIQFYTVNSNDNADVIRKYQAMHGFSFPTLWDADKHVAVNYGIDSLPAMILVDKSGKIRYATKGFDPEMDKVIPHILDMMVREG